MVYYPTFNLRGIDLKANDWTATAIAQTVGTFTRA